MPKVLCGVVFCGDGFGEGRVRRGLLTLTVKPLELWRLRVGWFLRWCKGQTQPLPLKLLVLQRRRQCGLLVFGLVHDRAAGLTLCTVVVWRRSTVSCTYFA